MIYDFLTIHFDDKGINVTNFMISTAFPKADLTNMDATILDLVTHTAAMLCYSMLCYSILLYSMLFYIVVLYSILESVDDV